MKPICLTIDRSKLADIIKEFVRKDGDSDQLDELMYVVFHPESDLFKLYFSESEEV